MSCYWTFYVIQKNADGLFDYVGGFDKDGRAIPLECRSRSFICGDTFYAWNTFNPDELTESASMAIFGKEKMTKEDLIGINFTYIPFTESVFEARDKMLIRGYVSIDEFDTITSNNYDSDYLRYEADIKTPEFIAAIPDAKRKKYVPLTWLDSCSDTYIYETIRHGCDMLDIFPFDTTAQYYILCEIG